MIAPTLILLAQLSHAPIHPTAHDRQAAAGLEAPAAGQVAAATLSGSVVDSDGRPVSGAVVTAKAGQAAEQQTTTGPDGRFTLNAPTSTDVTLTVRAGGFAEISQRIAAGAPRGALRIVVTPAPVNETVTVTPTRSAQRTGDVPASVSVLSREDIRQSPAVVADDVLRQVPTFSLFRRTSSLSSHPTAQGVSLRGLGPSGVSRTLVLLDGVPFNDPFGGWVYWTRVPLQDTDRIEVVDSPSSSLYGNYAMGGVINIVTARPEPETGTFSVQYGNLNSPKVDVAASNRWGKIGAAVDGSAFSTDGYPIVAASERGPVNNKASVSFRNANVKLDYQASDRVRAFLRVGSFEEHRNNGRASTIDGAEEKNNTKTTSTSGGLDAQFADGSALQVRLFGDSETFHSNFLAVSNTTVSRGAGRMSLDQTVPSSDLGGSVQWSRAVGPRQFVTAGGDWRWVKGESQEAVLDFVRGEQPVTLRAAGGRQQSAGIFAQDVVAVAPKLTVTLSGRVDHWRNYDGHGLETSVATGAPTANNKPTLPDRADSVFTPRVAAIYHVTDRVGIWGDFGTGFRAPTLNELYRQYRVGSVTTLPNDQLGPERLTGGELGVNLAPTDRVTVRGTWFDNRVKNSVSNVSQNAAGTLLMRENLGRTGIWGLQGDVEFEVSRVWKVSAAYVYDHATVLEYAGDPSLVGKFLPQVPKQRGSIAVTYANPRLFDATVSLQVVGTQYDDDQNTRIVPGQTAPGLPKFALVSFSASRNLTKNFALYIGAENLFNQTYYVGTLPTTIGTPRMVNVGLRVRFGQ